MNRPSMRVLFARKRVDSNINMAAATNAKPLVGDALQAAAGELYVASLLVEKRVMSDLKMSPLNDLAYAVNSRVKLPVRIMRKVLEMRAGRGESTPRPTYGPHSITDACGLRIVTLFQNQIPEVVKFIIRMVAHDRTLATFPFVKNALEEVSIYTNRPLNDPVSIKDAVIKIVKDAGFSEALKEPESRKSGYSSVHIILKVEIEIEESDGSKSRKKFPIEMQIRDIFEEAWGQIDHALRYKKNGEILGDDDVEMRQWLVQLNALKTHCDGCAQQAWLIRERGIVDAMGPSPTDPILKSIEPVMDAMQHLLDAFPSALHDLIRSVYQMRARAQWTWDRFSAQNMYSEIYGLLDKILEQGADHLDRPGLFGRPIRYQIDMERAFCLTMSAPDRLDIAVEIYEEILAEYSDDVVVRYRFGVALRKQNKLDNSIKLLTEGLKLLAADPTIEGDHWLRAAFPRNIGLSYYKMAKQIEATPAMKDEYLKFVRQAHEYTRLAYDTDIPDLLERLKTVNNLVFFTWQYLYHGGHSSKNISKKLLRELIAELSEIVSVDESDDFDTLDTLSLAHRLLGDHGTSNAIANRVATILHGIALRRSGQRRLQPAEIRGFLHEDEKLTFDSTLNALLENHGLSLGNVTIPPS